MRKLLLVVALSLSFSGSARACAILERANPRVGSTVAGPLDRVSLHFSMQVFPKDSTMLVQDAQNHAVSFGKPTGDPSDDAMLAIAVPDLSPGKYKVVWNVLAACGSHEPGDFKFTVAAPGTTASSHKGT